MRLVRALPEARLVQFETLGDDAENVAFFHDNQILAVELDLGPGPLAKQDLVARLKFERRDLAVLSARAGAYGNDFTLLRLLLSRIGDDDPASCLLLRFDAPDQHAIM